MSDDVHTAVLDSRRITITELRRAGVFILFGTVNSEGDLEMKHVSEKFVAKLLTVFIHLVQNLAKHQIP
jgi:hypothetical protein